MWAREQVFFSLTITPFLLDRSNALENSTLGPPRCLQSNNTLQGGISSSSSGSTFERRAQIAENHRENGHIDDGEGNNRRLSPCPPFLSFFGFSFSGVVDLE